jgi:hypothetical protein
MPTSAVSRPSRAPPVLPVTSRYRNSMGSNDGSIIATIIPTHMPRNEGAAPNHVCPVIRIHATDIVQPPGIPPISDMDAHHTIVPVALAAKSSAETHRKVRWEIRSKTIGASMLREMTRPRLLARDAV